VSALADVVTCDSQVSEETVDPIAWSIRHYLLGRLQLQQLDLLIAVRSLLISFLGLKKESHRLLG
jgi:hypothetical protein